MNLYFRKEIVPLSLQEILSHVVFEKPEKRKKPKHQIKMINGDAINMASWRYQTFAKSGTSCVCCGLEASYFAKERAMANASEKFHLNLYGLKDGEEIMFTKDHIVPKSLGGPDTLENFQTMCLPCNSLKGNKV